MKKKVLSTLLALTMVFSVASASLTAHAADVKEVNVFGIGDFGGKLDPVDSPTGDPGGAKIVGAMKALTAEAANPIVVTGGTSYTGSAISKLNHGTPVNEMYKAMGVKYVNIGNHDFDWSDIDTRETCFETWQTEGGFTFLNANVYYTEGDKAGQRLFTPYAVEEVDGVKVGFFGVIDPGNADAISTLNIKGLEFKATVPEALEVVKTLRDTEKCDVVIAMPHIASAQAKPDLDTPVGEGNLTAFITELNAECKKAGVKGIDGAFASQCETAHLTVIDGVPLVKAKNFGQIIAQLNIKIDGDTVTVTPSLHPLTQQIIKDGDKEESVLGSDENTRANIPEDAEFKVVYDKYNDIAMKVLDDPRGLSDTDFSEADAASKFAYQKWYLRQNWYYVNYVAGEPIVAYFQNCGGIRHIDPIEIKVGDPISLRLIQKMAPFDNYVVTMDMTGKDIKTILGGKSSYGTYDSLRQYGLEVTYASGEYEANAEVVSVKLNGEEIKDEETYRIGCNTFLSDGPGKDNMDFSAGTNVKKYDIINSNAVLEAVLDQSASLAALNAEGFEPTTLDYTVFIGYETSDAATVLAAKAAHADAAVDIQIGDLKVGANEVTVTVTAPYTDPNKTESTVSKVYNVNLVREYADQAAIPADIAEAVKALTAKGIFNGNGEGNFAADDTLTSDQLSVILARVCGADLSNVDTTLVHGEVADWAAPSVAWLIQNVSPDMCAPEYDAQGNITGYGAYLGFAIYGTEGLTNELTALAQYLKLDVDAAALVAGMGLEPTANITRGQLATALAQLLGA